MTFQEQTELELLRLFGSKGHVATSAIANGACKLSCAGLEFWIYPDGAQVSGASIDRRFEIYDYDSLRALQAAYLAFVRELI